MEKDFDYNSVPKTYLHCFNAQCPKAAKCLRYQVSQRVPSTTVILSALNPSHLADKKDDCSFFQPDCLSRFALGITHLLDSFPHADAVKLKREIYTYFQRNKYYRIYNKERFITPREQEFIRQLFLQNGIEKEPVFDEYIEKYNWD